MTEHISLEEYHRTVQAAQVTQRRRHTFAPHVMNGDERRYAEELEARRLAGDIHGWAFEPITLQLDRTTTYTPDFMLITRDGVQFVEIKGHLEDDASVKFKWARDTFSWAKWVMLRWKKGQGQWHKVRI